MTTSFRMRSLQTSLGVLCASFLLLSNCLFASLPTDSLDYGVSYPGGTFDAEESITYTVWLGLESVPQDSVVGFDLSFELTDDAIFPSSLSPDFSTSWIADGDSMTVSVTLNESTRSLRIEAERLSGSRSGHGCIVTFTLKSASNQVTADQLLNGMGSGSIITIDDWPGRRAFVDMPALKAYPNPSNGRMTVQGLTADALPLTLFDLSGRQVASFRQAHFDLRRLGLRPGVYCLRPNRSGKILRIILE
jgi:hypothetical protein